MKKLLMITTALFALSVPFALANGSDADWDPDKDHHFHDGPIDPPHDDDKPDDRGWIHGDHQKGDLNPPDDGRIHPSSGGGSVVIIDGDVGNGGVSNGSGGNTATNGDNTTGSDSIAW